MKKLCWLLPLLVGCEQNTAEHQAAKPPVSPQAKVAAPAKPAIVYTSGDRVTNGPLDTLHAGQGLVLRLVPGNKNDFPSPPRQRSVFSEARLIRQQGDGRVRRIGHTLVMQPLNGPELKFTDDTYRMRKDEDEETDTHCQFSGSVSGQPYWLVDSSWYEGGCLLLVSKKSGRVTRLLDNALISPDHKRLITFHFAALEGDIPGVALHDVTNAASKQVWHRELHQWQIERAVWLDKHTIAFMRRPLDSAFSDTVRYPPYVRLILPN